MSLPSGKFANGFRHDPRGQTFVGIALKNCCDVVVQADREAARLDFTFLELRAFGLAFFGSALRRRFGQFPASLDLRLRRHRICDGLQKNLPHFASPLISLLLSWLEYFPDPASALLYRQCDRPRSQLGRLACILLDRCFLPDVPGHAPSQAREASSPSTNV